jgi:hypothetical protein
MVVKEEKKNNYKPTLALNKKNARFKKVRNKLH